MTKRKKKACDFFKSIHERKNAPANIAYCVQVVCETHSLQWNALTDWDHAVQIMRLFPLVTGGLIMSSRSDALCTPGDDACELHLIPKLATTNG